MLFSKVSQAQGAQSFPCNKDLINAYANLDQRITHIGVAVEGKILEDHP
jgi:hypothetical protein